MGLAVGVMECWRWSGGEGRKVFYGSFRFIGCRFDQPDYLAQRRNAAKVKNNDCELGANTCPVLGQPREKSFRELLTFNPIV